MSDAWTALSARRRTNPGAPLVTYIDGDRGERVELSGTSVENAAAKIANAIREDFDLDSGSTIALHLPTHWQRTTWCAGSWTSGCVISLDDSAAADLIVIDERSGVAAPAESEVIAVSLHPFGLPISGGLPAGVSDATLAVRSQPDAYLFEPPQANLPAFAYAGRVLTQADVWQHAETLATRWGVATGGRLLVVEDLDPVDAWTACLAVPLVTGGSVVIVAGDAKLDAIIASERITAIASPQR